MALSQVLITNTSSGQLSLTLTLPSGQVISHKFLAKFESWDVGGYATLDELNRITDVHTAVTAGKISVTAIQGEDLAGTPAVVASETKDPVYVATTGAITLSGEQTIDGISILAGDRVLVKNQGAKSERGIYVASTDAWERAPDLADGVSFDSLVVSVLTGMVNGGTTWYVIGIVVVGTDNMDFAMTVADASVGSVTSAALSPPEGFNSAVYGPGLIMTVGFVAGGGGADDVTIFEANCPLSFSIVEARVRVTTAGAGGSTAQLFDAVGGGGNATSNTISTAATGMQAATGTGGVTTVATVALNGSLYLRRTDSTCEGELILYCTR